MSPSLAKLDVESLKRDIPKYRQNLPKAASNSWERWLNKIDDLIIVPDDYDWPVQKLKKAVRTEPANLTAHLSADLLELREKEIQPTQEVSTCRLYTVSSTCTIRK